MSYLLPAQQLETAGKIPLSLVVLFQLNQIILNKLYLKF